MSTTHTALLKITILQLLRSIGFDKAPPQTIDILTDLYIRHLQLVSRESLELAHLRGSEDIEIQDITQALINLGMLNPSNILDVFEQYDDYGGSRAPALKATKGGNKGVREFLMWVVGNVPERTRVVSRPTIEMLRGGNNGKKAAALGVNAVSAIPEYMNALNGVSASNTGTPGAEADHEINSVNAGSFNANNNSSAMMASVNEEEQEEEENQDIDWLTYVLQKSSKLGTVDEKFKNTVLFGGATKSDYQVIAGGAVVNEELEKKLPYNTRKALNEEDDDYP